MAKTEQGSFSVKYHHIDAPTKTDEEWGKAYKQRKLLVPTELGPADRLDAYRSPELWHLSEHTWFAWRKLDGENIRVHWDGEQALWNGKTDNFVCDANFKKYMEETFPEELFEEKFGRDKEVTLFGERVGTKVQKNELNLDHNEFVLFDVLIGNIWLDERQIQDVANFFNLHTPISFGAAMRGSLDWLIERVANGEVKEWEGIVATPCGGFRDRAGNRIIVKIKNKDYLRK